jgi:hypothetical protein
MIVMKLWKTQKYGMRGYEKLWKGWFLFGIIPLYIENYKTIYS